MVNAEVEGVRIDPKAIEVALKPNNSRTVEV